MAENEAPHRAGLFDIRFIIGSLIGLYGLIILITGFFTSDKQIDKSDGLNINIYAGIGMLVVGIAFGAWAMIRPIVVPADPKAEAAATDGTERPAH
jgi:hypothetical protein